MKQDKQAGGLAGIYQATSRGFGFLVPEDGGGREDDWFIPPRAEGGAWHGDRVLARPEDEGGEEGRRRTARITAVVERANKTVTGVLVWHNRGCGSGRTVTGCPAPSRCSPSGRGCGPGIGPPWP
ncbi:MAG: hypothetical protein ACLRZ3_08600 [Flavonifractor plautii]